VPERSHLATQLRLALETSCPGSRTELRGSLGEGRADDYSDIDLAWVVPDDEFEAAVAGLPDVLSAVQPVASLRSDPDFQRSTSRRLIFVRFDGVPLFWRLDLAVWKASTAFDESVDAGNPAARGDDWSLPESALMNALGTIKWVRRGRPDIAAESLRRGWERIGVPPAPEGSWADRIAYLTRQCAAQEPRLTGFANDVERLARELLAEQS
jgi:predicted nucleotidyltransferase